MAKNLAKDAGKAAVKELGWWQAHRFLLLRRACQVAIMALFMAGPTLGILTGNLSASMLFDTIPFADPLLTMQTLLTGHLPELTALVGMAIVLVIYAITAPRLFCGWVCPVNMITDLAAWLRRKLGLKVSYNWPSSIRYYLLAILLIGSAVSGTVLWSWLDPVATLHRGLIFGMGAGWLLILQIFLLDLLLVEHGWCGHLCPLGAMYGVVGSKSPVRVTATKREACNKCMDCFNVCPEPSVLTQPLKQGSRHISDKNCISCGRCIDVCSEKVFEYKITIGAKHEG